MHLLVLSAFRPNYDQWTKTGDYLFQCTFWCSALSDRTAESVVLTDCPVSMHLLVLSAFRRCVRVFEVESPMFQCTFWCSALSDPQADPRWAQNRRFQCTFWCSALSDTPYEEGNTHILLVSMHLLVLSAFRLRPQKTAPQRRLPERNRRRSGKHHIESACTCPIKPHNREKPPQTTPAPPTPPTGQYATDFQRTQAKKPTPHDYARVNFVLLGVQNPLLQSDAYFASEKTDTGLH